MFRNIGTFKDTLKEWPVICLGLEGYYRFGYGFNEKFALDATTGMNWGKPVKGNYDWTGWLMGSLAAKYRPWHCNHLFFLDYRTMEYMGCVGWVTGLPFQGREKWSAMVELGTVNPLAARHELEGITWRDFVPEFALLAIRHNIYCGNHLVAPNISGTISWNWNTMSPRLENVMLGVIWSLAP